MKWERHYTGTEIWNPRNDGLGFYVTREMRDKRIKFIRYTFPYYKLFRFTFGLFKGWQNYFRELGGYGFECFIDFTSWIHFRFGLSLPYHWFDKLNKNYYKQNPPKWRKLFQGYCKNNVVCFRVWWLCGMFDIPRFLARWLEKRRLQKIEKEMEEYYAKYEEMMGGKVHEDGSVE